MRRSRSRNDRLRGQTLMMVTIALIPMLGMAGLVVDLGYMYSLKSNAQAAADSAALAAVYAFNDTSSASVVSCGNPSWACNIPPIQCPSGLSVATNPVETACLYAKQNGFTSVDPQNVTITSSITPTIPTAPGVNSAAWWITVRVTQRVPQLFSAVMGNMSGTIAARASAAVQPGLGCVYALDPASSGSFYENGSVSFKSQCGIYVDSNASDAMLGNGGAVLQASAINDVGGVNWQGTISPTPNTGIQPFPDPLASLQPPSPPCSPGTGCNTADCSAHPTQTVINSNTTLSPGTYCGGIYVKSGTLTLNAGQYILVGGGIGTQDSNSHVKGSGLFFYNTYNSTNPYAPVNFNANSDVEISAATSGYYSGILFMQDRGCCSATLPTESFQGGATSFFEGVLYFPKSIVQFAGNPSLDLAHYTIVVAWQFQVKGTSTFNNDYTQLSGGNPIRQVGMVE